LRHGAAVEGVSFLSQSLLGLQISDDGNPGIAKPVALVDVPSIRICCQWFELGHMMAIDMKLFDRWFVMPMGGAAWAWCRGTDGATGYSGP
jgi:hypothetical protein